MCARALQWVTLGLGGSGLSVVFIRTGLSPGEIDVNSEERSQACRQTLSD